MKKIVNCINSLFTLFLIFSCFICFIFSNDNGIKLVNYSYGCDPSKVNTTNSTPTTNNNIESLFELTSDGNLIQHTNTFQIYEPNADFIVLHFSYFKLGINDYIKIQSNDSNYTKMDNMIILKGSDIIDSNFFTTALYTKSIQIQYYINQDYNSINNTICYGFIIDSYRYKTIDINTFLYNNTNIETKEEICGNGDESLEANCYKFDNSVFMSSNSVIRMTIHRSTGSIYCTGWLIGCEGHVITNNHCIGTPDDSKNVMFEFLAQGTTCSMDCAKGGACKGMIEARSATFISTDKNLDYTLLKLIMTTNTNINSKYGYLVLRETGPKLNERIYIPQHPAGYGKRIAVKDGTNYGTITSLNRKGCTGSNYDQAGYMLDTRGGSSGSPVLASSDHKVVALHHCGGCPNIGVQIHKIVDDMKRKNILPRCALDRQDISTSKPVTTAPITPKPVITTPLPTKPITTIPVTSKPIVTPNRTAFTPKPIPSTSTTSKPITTIPITKIPSPPIAMKKIFFDGSLYMIGNSISIDIVEFTIQPVNTLTKVIFDILSMETIDSKIFKDINNDCDASFLDSSILLLKKTNQTRDTNDNFDITNIIIKNDVAMSDNGFLDGSISRRDPYLELNLTSGHYVLAIGIHSLTYQDVNNRNTKVNRNNDKSFWFATCTMNYADHANYRLTITSPLSSSLKIISSPSKRIGSRCTNNINNNNNNNINSYISCPYHKLLNEKIPYYNLSIEGSIYRINNHISVDYYNITLNEMSNLMIDILSFETIDDKIFYDINKDCDISYIDPIIYIFELNKDGTLGSLITMNDDDDNFIINKEIRHSISFRDSFIKRIINKGNYTIAIGAFPLTEKEAREKKRIITENEIKSKINRSPYLCGKESVHGNYKVLFNSSSKFILNNNKQISTYNGNQCNKLKGFDPNTFCLNKN